MHSTNYRDTFIAAAPDSTATEGTAPRESATPSVALRTFRLIRENPYRYTSDDVLFAVHAERAGIPASERDAAREAFFAKPQACLRSSDLGKNYGWGIHSNGQARVALYGVETAEYARLASGTDLDGRPITVKPAMRSKRA